MVYSRGARARLAPNIGVMSSNPGVCTWSRRPNSCEERGLSGCKKGLKTVPLAQALLNLKPTQTKHKTLQYLLVWLGLMFNNPCVFGTFLWVFYNPSHLSFTRVESQGFELMTSSSSSSDINYYYSVLCTKVNSWAQLLFHVKNSVSFCGQLPVCILSDREANADLSVDMVYSLEARLFDSQHVGHEFESPSIRLLSETKLLWGKGADVVNWVLRLCQKNRNSWVLNLHKHMERHNVCNQYVFKYTLKL